MKFTTAFIAALATAVSGTKIELGDENTPLNLQKIADEVNSQNLSWKASVNSRFQ
jgi:hypothetical protein